MTLSLKVVSSYICNSYINKCQFFMCRMCVKHARESKSVKESLPKGFENVNDLGF